MMQVDSLTCAMTDMTVTSEECMEEQSNQTEHQLFQQKLYHQQQQQLLQEQQVQHLRQLQLEQQGQSHQQQIVFSGQTGQNVGERMMSNPIKETMVGSRCAMWT